MVCSIKSPIPIRNVMTDSSGYYGSWGGQTTPTSPYWQNLYDKKAEWGPCYYDVTHVLSTYAVYDIPFGRGRKYGTDINKASMRWWATGPSAASIACMADSR